MNETQDLTSIQWRSLEWLAVFGGLRPDNVLDYFAESPFWDNQSSNQILKMQSQHLGTRMDTPSELKKLTGKEFVVVQSNPPFLYVIRKQQRRSPTEVRPLATYYILNENIYQSPDLYAVLQNKMYTALHHLRGTWKMVQETPTPTTEKPKTSNAVVAVDTRMAMERALRDTQRHVFSKAQESAVAAAQVAATSNQPSPSPAPAPEKPKKRASSPKKRRP